MPDQQHQGRHLHPDPGDQRVAVRGVELRQRRRDGHGGTRSGAHRRRTASYRVRGNNGEVQRIGDSPRM